MSREDDKRIAEWLGYYEDYIPAHNEQHRELVWRDPYKRVVAQLPQYSTSDADAVTLLPALVERRFEVTLTGHVTAYHMSIEHLDDADFVPIWSNYQPSIHEAITAAVLAVIERESKTEYANERWARDMGFRSY